MEEATTGDSKEVEAALVVVHRMSDLTMPVPIANVLACKVCKEECSVTPATVQAVVNMGFEFYRVICSRCAAKEKDTTFVYKPFGPGQLAELERMKKFMNGVKRKGG